MQICIQLPMPLKVECRSAFNCQFQHRVLPGTMPHGMIQPARKAEGKLAGVPVSAAGKPSAWQRPVPIFGLLIASGGGPFAARLHVVSAIFFSRCSETRSVAITIPVVLVVFGHFSNVL